MLHLSVQLDDHLKFDATGKPLGNYHAGSFTLVYYGYQFPVAPKTYGDILSRRLDWLTNRLGEGHEDLYGGTVHDAARRFRRRTALNRTPSCDETMAVSKVRLKAMQTMLISDPSTRWPNW